MGALPACAWTVADERLRSLEREGNSAHATCRAVGHDWVMVYLGGNTGFWRVHTPWWISERPVKLVALQRPRWCKACGELEQRWGPWKPYESEEAVDHETGWSARCRLSPRGLDQEWVGRVIDAINEQSRTTVHE